MNKFSGKVTDLTAILEAQKKLTSVGLTPADLQGLTLGAMQNMAQDTDKILKFHQNLSEAQQAFNTDILPILVDNTVAENIVLLGTYLVEYIQRARKRAGCEEDMVEIMGNLVNFYQDALQSLFDAATKE